MAPTPEQHKAMAIYAAIMEEVKIRFQSIDLAIAGKTGFIAPLVQEYCYLQLRILCELIAFGCLLAHGDINPSEKLQKEYAADRIINELEKLHPHFYPQPVEQIKNGPNAWKLTVIQSGFLKKRELVELYRHCGDSLHRGNLKKLLAPNAQLKINLPRVIEATQKMSILLNHHLLALPGGKSVMICMLRNVDDRYRVQVVYGDALPGQIPVTAPPPQQTP